MMTIPHKNNVCSNRFPKWLDVKLTNDCNGSCKWCIEQGGYSPKPTNVKNLVESINNQVDYKNVLLLGGEPLLYDNLEYLLKNIRPFKKNIYMTTNGTIFNDENLDILSKYLDGINISIHHHDDNKNYEILGLKHNYKYDKILNDSIKYLNNRNIPIRFNCNLIKGYTDTKEKVNLFYEKAEFLKVKEVIFKEILKYDKYFVDARTIWDNITCNPFVDGCVQTIKKGHNTPVIKVKLTCGANDHKKNIVDNPIKSNRCKVIYPDASVYDGWVNNDKDISCHGGHC